MPSDNRLSPSNLRLSERPVGTRGVFTDTPWVHQSEGLEVLQFYHEWPPELKRLSNQTGGFALGEEQMHAVLHGGINALKAGSLVWDGDTFRGTVNGNIPIKGQISNFNKKGLPRQLTYTYAGGPTVKALFEYGNTNVPAFLPSVIRRPLPWLESLSRGRFASSIVTTVHEWKLGNDGILLDPSTRFPKAVQLHYTNGQWMRIEGTNMIPMAN